MAATKLLLGGLMFPEGPRWHDGKLWFSDMHAHKVMTVDLNGRAEAVCEVPAWPSGLGWLPDGRMLIVSMTDRKLLRLDTDGLKTHAYVGNFGYDLLANAPQKPAEIVMVTPDGAARIVAKDLQFPNGAVFTPDGKTLIVGESMGHRMSAFDVQADGSLTNH